MSVRNIIDMQTLKTQLPGARPEVQTAIAAYGRRVATDYYADGVLSITLYGSQARGDADNETYPIP